MLAKSIHNFPLSCDCPLQMCASESALAMNVDSWHRDPTQIFQVVVCMRALQRKLLLGCCLQDVGAIHKSTTLTALQQCFDIIDFKVLFEHVCASHA